MKYESLTQAWSKTRTSTSSFTSLLLCCRRTWQHTISPGDWILSKTFNATFVNSMIDILTSFQKVLTNFVNLVKHLGKQYSNFHHPEMCIIQALWLGQEQHDRQYSYSTQIVRTGAIAQQIEESNGVRNKLSYLPSYATTMGSNALSSCILILNHCTTHESFMQESLT